MFNKERLSTLFLIFILAISPSVNIITAATDVPLSGAMILADGDNGNGYGITNASGQYLIDQGLKTGTYNLTAFVEGYIGKELPNISVQEGSETPNNNFLLLRSGGISGKVTDSLGQAVKDIMIYAISKTQFGYYGLTDSSGNYKIITNLETGTYNLTTPYAKGYISSGTISVSVTAGVETKNVNMVLAKSGVITGKITSTVGGQPLKGITVYAMGDNDAGLGSTQTDAAGDYRIDSGLGTGKYTLTVMSGTSFNMVPNISVTAGQETSNINTTLSVTPPAPSGTIKGRVTDMKNDPVVGAQVSASGTAGSKSDLTDSDGDYEISSGLGTGTYTVSVTESGYLDSQKTGVSVTIGSITAGVNFQLQPLPTSQSGKISGTVRGEANPLVSKTPSAISCSIDKTTINTGDSLTASGAISPAVSGVTVSLTFKKETTSIPVTVTTGSDGKYSSTYKPTSTGSWTVSASWTGNTVYSGAASQSAAFTVNEVATNGNLKIIAKDSTGNMIVNAVISSTAQPSGQPALSGTTQTDGSVTFTGVKPGSYTLQAVKTGLSTATGTQAVASGSTASITLTLQNPSTTTGDLKVTVKDSSGVAISGVSVTSTAQPSGQSALSGTTGADGTATFTGIILGAYTIQAVKSDYTTATGTGSAVAGSITTITITLKSSSSGGGIPGFPIQSTIMGITLAVILLWALQRKLQPIKNNVF